VVLEDGVHAEPARGEARGVQRQVRLLPCAAAEEREGALAEDGLPVRTMGPRSVSTGWTLKMSYLFWDRSVRPPWKWTHHTSTNIAV
jgi:hypothetical protein